MATEGRRPAGKRTVRPRAQTETHVVTTMAGNVRITEPKNSGPRKKPRITVLVSPEGVVGSEAKGFANFLKEYAVVGLAVGFVVGTQVQAVMKQLIASFIDPLFKLLFGNKLSNETVTLHFHGRTADFGWGSFVYVLLDLLFVLLVVYLLVRILKLDKLKATKK